MYRKRCDRPKPLRRYGAEPGGCRPWSADSCPSAYNKTEEYYNPGDLNEDGKVDFKDLVRVKKVIVGEYDNDEEK